MKRFTLLVFGLLALVAFAQEPMVAFRTLKGSSMICVTNYGPYIVAALADKATTQYVEQAIAAIPAPTGVPIWYDSVDTNIFATIQNGTATVWKVTQVWDGASYDIIFNNFSTTNGHAPTLSRVTVSDALGNGKTIPCTSDAVYWGVSTAGGSWSTDTKYLKHFNPSEKLRLTIPFLSSIPATFANPVGTDGTPNGTAVFDYHYVTVTSALHRLAFISDLPSTNDLASAESVVALAAIVTNAPAWLVYSNRTGSVTLTNSLEKPIILQGTGAVSLAFSGLRSPRPLYAVLAGFSSVAFPSNTYIVGGGAWQTNRANHFIIWNYGSGIYVNPLTTTE